MKAEENLKTLKTFVHNFDNPVLIEIYAKDLIGRCMILSQHDVNVLLIILPKIQKMEDRVVGAEMGLGHL